MITKRKKYIIQLFLKRCTLQSVNKDYIDFYFKLYKNMYNISEEKLEKLKQKYNINDYIERIIPLIDEQFSIEELQEIIKFYSSKTGRKIIDFNFLHNMGKIRDKMMRQIEQEFALNSKNYL